MLVLPPVWGKHLQIQMCDPELTPLLDAKGRADMRGQAHLMLWQCLYNVRNGKSAELGPANWALQLYMSTAKEQHHQENCCGQLKVSRVA